MSSFSNPETFQVIACNEMKVTNKYLTALFGILTGMVADNHLSSKEFEFLHHWLEENEYAKYEWPGNLVSQKVKEIISDGVVTQGELDSFKDIMKDLIGFTKDDTGSSQSTSTSLPLNKNANIDFKDKTFCFTGKFIYGSRQKCFDDCLRQGAIPADSITKKLDYLVIGFLGSDMWINTSYGTKIKKAVEYQEKGHNLQIVDENMWVEKLKSS